MKAVFSCRLSAQLVSDTQERRLAWHHRIVLRLHLMMCARCRTYARQIRSFTALLRQRASQHDGALDPGGALSPQARARILLALRKSTGG